MQRTRSFDLCTIVASSVHTNTHEFPFPIPVQNVGVVFWRCNLVQYVHYARYFLNGTRKHNERTDRMTLCDSRRIIPTVFIVVYTLMVPLYIHSLCSQYVEFSKHRLCAYNMNCTRTHTHFGQHVVQFSPTQTFTRARVRQFAAWRSHNRIYCMYVRHTTK